jgi:hypothetical protein
MTKRDAVGAIEGATNWPPRLGFELRALGNPPHDGIPAPRWKRLYCIDALQPNGNQIGQQLDELN